MYSIYNDYYKSYWNNYTNVLQYHYYITVLVLILYYYICVITIVLLYQYHITLLYYTIVLLSYMLSYCIEDGSVLRTIS